MKEVPLKRLTSEPVKNGLGLAGSESNPRDPRYIRITDIGPDGLLRNGVFASQPRAAIVDSWVERGDVLVASVGGTVGKSYLHQVDGDYCFAGYLSRVRPNRALLNPKFLHFWTQSTHYWDQVLTNLVASTIENLSASRVAALKIPHHDALTQRAIADYLDHETAEIDAFIAELNELRQLGREHTSATIASLMDDPGASNIETRLGRVIAISQGQVDPQVPPFNELPLVAPNHIESRTGRLLNVETSEAQGAESGKYLVRSGQVIYCKIRPALMKATIVNFQTLCSADMYALDADQKWLINEYLLEFLLSPKFESFAVTMSDRVAMPKLNRETLSEAPITLPDLHIQRRVVALAGDARTKHTDLQTTAEHAIRLAQERRAALITAAVTGQIDVAQRHKPAAEVLEDEVGELV